jgi:DNA-directed RNA polymerase subunit RPC12/RpoP
MEFQDRVLKCTDCGAEFVYTAGEQVFFHDKQFKNDPKHCKQCKAKRVRGSRRARSETKPVHITAPWPTSEEVAKRFRIPKQRQMDVREMAEEFFRG